ncbi:MULTISPECIES: hypothetical protein [Paenibacillus]|uniref:Uncharacterized protein n=1 Tax=Paenibacillus albilobatus TaxID=2716884 RepID=A0A919XBU3_9BACL|nr:MULTISPECIES: hypothetical protein [Paenibacillus]GIO29762.1 hypothetical protein J2TS6_09030 [Paenibacillus albilobatus]
MLKHFGIDSIAAGYGYGSEEERTAIRPAYHVQTVEELIAFLEGIWSFF